MNSNSDKLQRSYNELIEYKLVLEKVTALFACLAKKISLQLYYHASCIIKISEHTLSTNGVLSSVFI